MRRILLLVALFLSASGLSYGQTSNDAWINEINYDDDGTDFNEFIEIVIKNPSSYTLSNFKVTLYNGSNGTQYDEDALDSFTVGATDGDYTIYSLTYSSNGIQNGGPDGVALSYNGSLIQFLSYEGSFTANNGVASGQTSTDIGVSENNSSGNSNDLYLTGTGSKYSDFTWTGPSAITKGTVNTGQTLSSTSSIPSLSLTGSAGFRMLSTPVAVTYSSFLDPIWTQGATTGADATTGDPNVFTWNTSTGAYSGVTDLSGTISAGSGFMVYVFADDDFNGSADAFPKTLSVSGTENAEGTSVNVNATGDGYTLVGNPFASTIDFDNVTKTDLTNTAYVWDNTTSDWKDWNSDSQTGDLTDGLITTYQGFFVRTATTPAGTPSVAFPSGAKSSGGTFYGKAVSNMREAVRFEVSGQDVSNSAWITFNEFGSINQVMADAVELESLNSDYAKLAIVKDDVLINTANLPNQTENSYSLPVEISATKAGTYTISATDFNLSDDKTLTFYDYKTGFSATVNENFAYSFELDAPVQKRTATALLAGPIEAQSTETGRFGIKIDPAVINSNEEDATPQAFSLEQNYPNPFNPSTTIEYSVDKAGAVNLSVYNLMGQKVAELVNEAKSAGSYKVQWNAGGAASGMYYYRLDANGVSITRKMTLIK